MGKSSVLEKDWYRKLASKRQPAVQALSDMAETTVRNLDVSMAKAAETKRQRRQARMLAPVDLTERFTVTEVAQRLKLAESTVYDLIKQDLLDAEHHGKSGRAIRISQRALEDYLRKR